MPQKLIFLLSTAPDSETFPIKTLKISANAVHPLSIEQDSNLEHFYLQFVQGKRYPLANTRFYQLFQNPQKIIQNPAFQSILAHTKNNASSLHLIFPIGDPNLSIDQILNFLELLPKGQESYLHLILGRDAQAILKEQNLQAVQKNNCYQALQKLETGLEKFPQIQIASLGGADFLDQDADLGYQKVQIFYDSIVFRQEQISNTAHEHLYLRLLKGNSPSSLSPISMVMGDPLSDQDALVFFNPSQRKARDFFACFAKDLFLRKKEEQQVICKSFKHLAVLTAQQFWEGGTTPSLVTKEEKSVFLSQLLAQQDIRQAYISLEGNQIFVNTFINPESKQLFDGQKKILIPQVEMKNAERKVLTENQKIYTLSHPLQSQTEFFFYDIDWSEESMELLELLQEWSKDSDQDFIFINYAESDPLASKLYYF